MRFSPAVLFCLSLSFAAGAADLSADKSQFTLFNPTPRELMRPLSSDEADRVIGPYTVDAGHVQLESDLVNYFNSFQRRFTAAGESTHSFEALAWDPRVKLGLCNRVDLEVHVSTFANWSHTRFDGLTQADFHNSASGVSSVLPKLKINLWGNDGGTTALAIAPYVAIPTRGPNDVTGGFEILFAWKLPKDFLLKTYFEVFPSENSHRTVYAGFNNSASLTKSLNPHVDVFANFTSSLTTRPGNRWIGYAGFGAAYNLTSDFQVYAGMRFGVTSSANDYNPYLGLTWRL